MNVQDQINAQKEATEQAKNDLLRTFSFVPNDKLDWSPAETARTPLWMVAHCGEANKAFASIIRGEKPQLPDDPEEMAKMIRFTGKDTKTREEAVKSVEEGAAAVIAALDTVTDERYGSMTDSPFGPVPFPFWTSLGAIHMTGHARQLDYLETIWGDIEDHM